MTFLKGFLKIFFILFFLKNFESFLLSKKWRAAVLSTNDEIDEIGKVGKELFLRKTLKLETDPALRVDLIVSLKLLLH